LSLVGGGGGVSLPWGWAWDGGLLNRFDERMSARLQHQHSNCAIVTIEARAITFPGREDTMFTEPHQVALLGIVKILAPVWEIKE